MKKYLTLLIIWELVGLCLIMGQSSQEEILLRKIQEITSVLPERGGDDFPPKGVFKTLKELGKEASNDLQLSAVAYAKIGQALSQKNFYGGADYFYKKSLNFRKQIGDFLPQRWALNALMNNAVDQGNFASLYRYAKKWITLTEAHPAELTAIYKHYQWENAETFYVESELSNLLIRIHPIDLNPSQYAKFGNWEERRKYSHALLKYYLKKFPAYRVHNLDYSRHLFEHQYITLNRLNKGNEELAENWIHQQLKLVKPYTNSAKYADFVRFFASLCRNREKVWRSRETTPYEHIGISLMEDYIQLSKNIQAYDQVLFAYRYIATRYAVLKDYRTSVQYLATAIKYCHIYDLEDEVVNSYGGLRSLLAQIPEESKDAGIQEARAWKDSYSTKGLNPRDIAYFDDVLNGRK